jgi:hypothetical protein
VLPPCRSEFEPKAKRTRNYFQSVARFEPGSLGLMTMALANSAMPPSNIYFQPGIHKLPPEKCN